MNKIRRKESPRFWEKHVQEWYSTIDEPKSEYCKRNGLVLHRFTYWQKKFEGEADQGDDKKWINIFDDTPSQSKDTDKKESYCEIEFGNGTRLILKGQPELSILESLIPLVKC